MKSKTYSDQKNWSDTYLTDPKLIDILGPFIVDPCCPPDMPWKTAHFMFTVDQDGLSQQWPGRTFMNPPYRGVMKWAEKFVDEGVSGIALLNGRSSETKASQLIMSQSDCIWFPKGRLTFYKQDGTPYEQKWFPSLLIGMRVIDRIKLQEACDIYGGQIFYK